MIPIARTFGAPLGLIALLLTAAPAFAHPHMWITYEMTVDYNNGMVTGVDHVWSFADAYAGMALEGLRDGEVRGGGGVCAHGSQLYN